MAAPGQDGGEDDAAAVDDGVLVVLGGQGAPVLTGVEGALDDVAAAVGDLVELRRADAGGAPALAVGDLVGRLRDDALSPMTAPGRVRGRPGPTRGTQIEAISGPNIGESWAWPGVTSTTSGRPRPSTIACVFVVRPPRDRPMP